MNNSPESTSLEILRRLSGGSLAGEDLTQLARTALAGTTRFLELEAVSLILWDAKFTPTLTVTHADRSDAADYLARQELEVFRSLREEESLVAARLSFGGPHPHILFTLPLEYRSQVFGAIIGYQKGKGKEVAGSEFLETFAAFLTLHVAAGISQSDEGSAERIEREKLAAVIQTAVTVNHEVNNPLTAILGNVQLLLLKRTDLDEEVRAKLRTIEESAMKIKDVTHALLGLTRVRTKEYTEGTSMLDLRKNEGEI